MINDRLNIINEIAIRNEIPFNESVNCYTKCYCRVYKRNSLSPKPLQYGHPDLENKIFDMTEKHIGISKWRDLRKGR